PWNKKNFSLFSSPSIHRWSNNSKFFMSYSKFAMTHNLCMDLHRKRQRRAQNTDRIEEIAVTDPDIVASKSDSPESAILLLP
ncbi:MAG: hypothetical protein AAFW70_30300, partial [Cyanobacteria bacterium J06635_10]